MAAPDASPRRRMSRRRQTRACDQAGSGSPPAARRRSAPIERCSLRTGGPPGPARDRQDPSRRSRPRTFQPPHPADRPDQARRGERAPIGFRPGTMEEIMAGGSQNPPGFSVTPRPQPSRGMLGFEDQAGALRTMRGRTFDDLSSSGRSPEHPQPAKMLMFPLHPHRGEQPCRGQR